MNKKDLTSRCTGIYFGEGPRWKENKLWFSDMQGDKVYTLDEDINLAKEKNNKIINQDLSLIQI